VPSTRNRTFYSFQKSRRQELSFSVPISFAQFTLDGKRLFVLTSDQVAYLLDLSPLAPSAQQR